MFFGEYELAHSENPHQAVSSDDLDCLNTAQLLLINADGFKML